MVPTVGSGYREPFFMYRIVNFWSRHSLEVSTDPLKSRRLKCTLINYAPIPQLDTLVIPRSLCSAQYCADAVVLLLKRQVMKTLKFSEATMKILEPIFKKLIEGT